MYILLQMKFRREVAREKKNSFLIFYQYILSLTYIKPTNEKGGYDENNIFLSKKNLIWYKLQQLMQLLM